VDADVRNQRKKLKLRRKVNKFTGKDSRGLDLTTLASFIFIDKPHKCVVYL
jgi:hypothetical protein